MASFDMIMSKYSVIANPLTKAIGKDKFQELGRPANCQQKRQQIVDAEHAQALAEHA